MLSKKKGEKGADTSALEAAVNQVKADQEDLARQVAELQTANGAAEEALQAEMRRLEEKLTQRCKNIEDMTVASASQQRGFVDALRKELGTSHEATSMELAARCDALERESQALRPMLSELAGVAKEDHTLLEECRVGMQRISEMIVEKVVEVDASCQRALAEQDSRTQAAIESVLQRLSERCDGLRADLDGLSARMEETTVSRAQAQEEHASSVVTQMQGLKLDFEKQIGEIQLVGEAQAAQLAALERELGSQRGSLSNAARLAENIFTRSLVWQARGFKKRLASMLEVEDQIIRSPDFSVCGLPEMRLEVQMACADSAQAIAPSLPLPGSCSIGVWGLPGYRMVFQLTVGEGAGAVSRRFEHHFQPGGVTDEASRVLFVAQNFCRLNNVWVKHQDCVRVSFELLELQGPPTEPAAAAAACPATPQSPAATPRDECDTAKADAEARDQEVGTGSGSAHSSARSSTRRGPEDIIELSRAFTAQELVHERLSSELVAVKNRSVRRVEWALEGCSRLLESRVGESVDSPVFSAAGLERIQFHFYPRDISATGSAAQPCALYISGPSHTTLRGMMWVGSASRPLDHRYQRRGDTAGRSRFVNLEHQVDCSDRVVIALDISEVEVDMRDQPSASLCLRAARTQPGADDGGAASPPHASSRSGLSATSPLSGTRGSLRMKRDDPSKTEEFVKCVSLPTLNARQLKLPLAQKSVPRCL